MLIGFTIILMLFVAFSGLEYKGTPAVISVCFAISIVSILVVGRLLDYPFEGALALRPSDFIDLFGKLASPINL
ncbi:hypothetical protein [Lichenicoccus sp.]|uniref:hypothetical protein n=1 Tax=Lichenicoccus sp. TaxID=2781899 RepID=UPI003D137497